ncbi:hypothetical protein L3Q82_022445 [Scortum barcoo]|uniref:Uncharacterized protein n=1 Tax=Scortum barcoo TaxID=214431 RepID=A0ACB8X1K4_9TELE|nr:hypothetical protein L3Q82_022445 [Scortum barcoo]
MDSADANTIKTALDTQAYRLKHHDAQLSNIAAGVKQLTDSQADLQASVATKVNQLTDQMQSLTSRLEGFIATLSPSPPAAPAPPASPATAAAAPPQPPPAPFSLPVSSAPVRLASPPKFSGESGECRPFLIQCDLHFSMDLNAFGGASSSCSFMVSHNDREGGCLGYGRVVSPRFVKQLKTFLKLCSVFLTRRLPHGKRLLLCSKSNRDAGGWWNYALEFRTLAADSGWNETSIISAFIDGLTEEVKDFLAPLDIPKDFESLVEIASDTSTIASVRGRERRRPGRKSSGFQGAPHSFREFRRSSHLSTPVPESPSPPAGAEEPMQLGRTKLAPEERQRRLKEGVCFYCGKSGHQVKPLPSKRGGSSGLRRVLDADESLMDKALASSLGINFEPLHSPVTARSLRHHLRPYPKPPRLSRPLQGPTLLP